MITQFVAAVFLALSASVAAAQTAGVITIPNIPLFPLVPAVPYYQVTDLGVLDGTASSTAIDINNNNVIVGRSGISSFVYSGCRMSDLGTLGGQETVVEDIHDSGSIVGWSRNAQGVKRPFLRAGGVMSDVGDALIGEANAIGDWNIPAGIITAHESLPGNAVYFINNESFMMPRVNLSATSWSWIEGVTDMTDHHRVLGFMSVGSERWGMVSANGFGQWTRIKGIPGYEWFVTPFAINNSGYVVGESGNGQLRAFLSTNPNEPALDLGALPGGNLSWAHDINNNNWIVGWADQDTTTGPRAVVRPPGGNFVDLNTRLVDGNGWFLQEAIAINDSGRIVGNGAINGQRRAFLLTPTGTRLPPRPCVLPPISTR
jgi:probable HAF family extracellular repeat protein